MRNMVIAAWWLLYVSVSPLLAQDWTAVRALPKNTPVRIEELGGQGGRLQGRIEAVEDTQLTLLVGKRSVRVPRASVGRLARVHRDRLWNGMLIGAALSLTLRVAFAGDACAGARDPQCTIKGTLVGAGIGAFIDSQITESRVVYDARQPTLTLLRLSF